ncbi:hypothetical protein LSAT2_018267 [Lamellibrachia satsuma]|nr:hypothetical protein LSAT2_018267 [Lamellibrachia satsuma]
MARSRCTHLEKQELLQNRHTMKLSHVPWVFVLLAVVLGEVLCADSARLPLVSNVALDWSTSYPENMTVKAIYIGFNNNHSVHVQLWAPKNASENTFTLVWQKEVTGSVANGKPEVIELTEKERTTVRASDLVGIQNEMLPGPVESVFKVKGGVTLSKTKTFPDTLVDGTELEFDELKRPMAFFIRLCNTSDCYYERYHPAKPKPVPARVSLEEENLLSRGMIIGLIAWNIAITFVLLIVIIAVICVCVEMDTRKSKHQRRDNMGTGSRQSNMAYDNIEEPTNGVEPGWQTSASWKPDSGIDAVDTTDEHKLTDDDHKSAL